MENYYIDGINAVYIICMSLGILLSITALIFGSGHGAAHTPHGSFDHSAIHIGHHGASSQVQEGTTSSTNVPLLNINALFAFLIGFGAAGLIAYGILKVALLSLIPALAIGSLFWFIVRKLLSSMLKGQSKFLTTSLDDIIGVTGTVSSVISDQRVGEVIYTIEGGTRAIPAKHKHPGEVQRGEIVVIIGIVDGVAMIVKNAEFNLEFSLKV
ncbi:MAG: NfeD family protein [Desulfosporosinus sp.]|nr:NfeD family protein [Desulfosporosinus sp.]